MYFSFLLVKLKIAGVCFFLPADMLPMKMTLRARVTQIKRNKLCDLSVIE